jgi:hypothetical protein
MSVRERRVVGAVAAVLVLGVGCGSGGSPTASSDCQGQVRFEGAVFTGHSVTRRQPSAPVGLAEKAACHDVGADPAGSVFGADARQVEVWSFEGYDPDEVLAVRFGAASWTVFIAETVSPSSIEEITRELL